MGVRERTQSKRKSPQRKMKIPLMLLVACVASLKAASLMDVYNIECPAECCSTTTNVPTTTADPTTGPTTTADPTADPSTTSDPTTTEGPTTTEEPVTTEDPTTTEGPTTTEEPITTEEPTTTEGPATTANQGREATEDPDICSTCDPSTCEQGGAGSASLSLLVLLLPAFFARLL